MATNEILELLDHVLATGTVPADDEIRSAVTKYRSVAERTELANKLRREIKRTVNALDAGLVSQAEEHAADVAAAMSRHTSAGATTEELPERGWSRKFQTPPTRAPRSYGERQLVDVLGASAHSGLRTADVEQLINNVSAHDRDEFRDRLEQAAREVRDLWSAGNQADSRNLSKQHAVALGGFLAEPEPTDPTDGVDDPRALADLVRARNGR